jgi:hypothetical protein
MSMHIRASYARNSTCGSAFKTDGTHGLSVSTDYSCEWLEKMLILCWIISFFSLSKLIYQLKAGLREL